MRLNLLLLASLAASVSSRDNRKTNKRAVRSGCVLTYDAQCYVGADLGNGVMRFTVRDPHLFLLCHMLIHPFLDSLRRAAGR